MKEERKKKLKGWGLALLNVVIAVGIIIGVVAFVKVLSYETALKKLKEGKYREAYESLKKMDGYRDSEQWLEEAKIGILRNATVGSTVFLGSYWSSDERDSEEREDIEWKVLEVKDGKAMLISEKLLDYSYFLKTVSRVNLIEEGVVYTWENSYLRSYLNGYFFDQAFSEKEKTRILETTVKPDRKALTVWFRDVWTGEEAPTENETIDRVYVLSYAELLKYFPTEDSRECSLSLYVMKMHPFNGDIITRAMYTSDKITQECYSWWLRDTYDTENGDHYTCFVDYKGRVDHDRYSHHAIRPVIWISIE